VSAVAAWRPILSSLFILTGALYVVRIQVYAQSSGAEAQHLYDQAQIAIANGQPEQAISLLRRVVELDPKFVDAYIRLAETLTGLGRFREAREVLHMARQVAPSHGGVRAWLVYAHFSLKEYEDAIREGKAAQPLLNAVDAGTVAYYVGMALQQLGRHEEAIVSLGQAAANPVGGPVGLAEAALIELYPRVSPERTTPELRLRLSRLLLERERYLEALSILNTITSGTPSFAPAYYWLGFVNIRIAEGFTNLPTRRRYMLDAHVALKKYLELAPDGEFSENAKKLLSNISRETTQSERVCANWEDCGLRVHM
jgi:tetratricopeptide (TPR) repeat protein